MDSDSVFDNHALLETMMVDASDITHQSLSSLLGVFYRCQKCNKVDSDRGRSQVGHPCSNCGMPSPGARLYFSLPTLRLIDLTQGLYHLEGQGVSFTW